MLPELTIEEFSGALDAVAAEAIEVLDLAAPPVDALDLAHKLEHGAVLGVVVARARSGLDQLLGEAGVNRGSGTDQPSG